MKKIIWIFIVLVILIATISNLPKILGLITSDTVSVNEKGLELGIIEVPTLENAFFDLGKASSLVSQLSVEEKALLNASSSSEWDITIANNLVLKNDQALVGFSATAQKNNFQNPLYYDLTTIALESELPPLNTWRTLAKVSSLKSRVLLNDGKDEAALNEAIKSIKVGNLIINSNGSLIEYVVGIAIKNIGLDLAKNIVENNKLSRESLLMTSTELGGLYDKKDGLAATFVIEHNFRKNSFYGSLSDPEFLNNLNEVTTNKLPQTIDISLVDSFYFRPNETVQLSADYALKQVENSKLSCDAVKNITDPKKLATTSFIKAYLTENIIGKILQDSISSSLKTVYTKSCETDLKVSSLISLIESKYNSTE